ncbi:hypothetical protein GGR06_003101 [Bacteroides reticulotermitis]|uniref:Uncharacterized protein n=1 Tax=Bacteroides reticulotermitis TaxID=1133319 RepID=A0A840D395_9BACE|nr:hypothetical protein [Bacteroides reticulotermitis]
MNNHQIDSYHYAFLYNHAYPLLVALEALFEPI